MCSVKKWLNLFTYFVFNFQPAAFQLRKTNCIFKVLHKGKSSFSIQKCESCFEFSYQNDLTKFFHEISSKFVIFSKTAFQITLSYNNLNSMYPKKGFCHIFKAFV